MDRHSDNTDTLACPFDVHINRVPLYLTFQLTVLRRLGVYNIDFYIAREVNKLTATVQLFDFFEYFSS